MLMNDWLIGIGIFVLYATIDSIFALHTLSVVEGRKLYAANTGSFLYLLVAIGTISYTDNPWFIVPMVLGSWVGNYCTIWWKET